MISPIFVGFIGVKPQGGDIWWNMVKKGTSCEVLTPNFLGTTAFVGGFSGIFSKNGSLQ